MKKGSKDFEAMLIESAEEALEIARGKKKPARAYSLSARDATVAAPPEYDAARIRKLRERLNLSQQVFADVLNVSGATIRAWEQGARVPDGPTLRLLEIADRHPRTMLSAVKRRPATRRVTLE